MFADFTNYVDDEPDKSLEMIMSITDFWLNNNYHDLAEVSWDISYEILLKDDPTLEDLK